MELERRMLEAEETVFSKGDYIPTGYIVRFECGWFVEYVNKNNEDDFLYCN